MFKKTFSLFLIVTSLICTDNMLIAQTEEKVASPEQIEQELEQAQHDFEIAEKMFKPWYTGPLITGSARNVPPGMVNLQPYLYSTVNYAQFNKHSHSVNTPNTYILNPLMLIQTGIISWLDVSVIPQAFFRWKKGHFGDNFADLPLQFGFQIQRETPYLPNIRFLLGELFPTGKYQHLKPRKLGIDATGQGAFSTIIGLNISKIFWWLKLHPLAARLATNYIVPDHRVHVHNFNSFGGGFHTDGKVKVGNTFNADLGLEFSLTQHWVLATDVAYTYSNKSTFHGKSGKTALGAPAANGAPSSSQLSLSPAIEYNVTSNAGFIGGVWFSVAGRNSSNFASLVLSYNLVF
jgi:hypothetical protein